MFKPSEIAPAVGAWMAERWREAGPARGRARGRAGRAPTPAARSRAADVDGILFTGSYATGRALDEATLDAAAASSSRSSSAASNAMIVCADADLDLAVSEAALSIAATTGQRCTARARIFVERPVRERFQEKLARVLAGLRVGAPLDEGVFMGPLARTPRTRGSSACAASRPRPAASACCSSTRAGRRPTPAPGLVRFESTAQRHPYQREEIFGPEAALYPVDDLDEAIAAANDSDYGLAASVITRDRAKYEHCIGRIRTGVLNWNSGTIGASGRLPFGGSGRSGNDRPAGVTATLYCTAPQAHLESEAGFDPSALPPGMPEAVTAVAQRWVLMGDPTHFSVKGGANPHTRTRWGTRRTRRQRSARSRSGTACATLLEELGVRVLVVPPVAEWPGTVYPANAGFLFDVDTPSSRAAQKRFVLANLLPTRAGEQAHYARVLAARGIPLRDARSAAALRGRGRPLPGRRALPVHARPARAPALRARARASRPGSASTASAPTRACASSFAPQRRAARGAARRARARGALPRRHRAARVRPRRASSCSPIATRSRPATGRGSRPRSATR